MPCHLTLLKFENPRENSIQNEVTDPHIWPKENLYGKHSINNLFSVIGFCCITTDKTNACPFFSSDLEMRTSHRG
jgi:hypothetical protein